MKTLNEISDLTGGKSYMAGSEDSLKEILVDIQKLEKTKIQSQSQIIYDELFFPYLLWGILLFLFGEISRKLVIKEVS